MRHSKRRHILGVSGPHRAAMYGNLSVALINHGRIKTTLAKAKALRPFIEKIITLAKKANQTDNTSSKLHFRRLAISRVRDKKAIAVLFDQKVEEFSKRPGGYTRIYKIGQRVGDAAEMALIELIDANDEGYPKKSNKTTKNKTTKTKKSVKVDDDSIEEKDNDSIDSNVDLEKDSNVQEVDEKEENNSSDPDVDLSVEDAPK